MHGLWGQPCPTKIDGSALSNLPCHLFEAEADERGPPTQDMHKDA